MNYRPHPVQHAVDETLWWLFRAPTRARVALERRIMPPPLAATMVAGAVTATVTEAWSILGAYLLAAGVALAAARALERRNPW